MRCRDARVALSARLDGELDHWHVGSLDAHLAGCASCRDEQRHYDSLRSRLRLSEPMTVDLVPRLREPMAAPPSAVGRIGSAHRRPHAPRSSGVLIAVAAAAVIVTVFVTRAVDTPTRVSSVAPGRPPELAAPHGAQLLLAWTSGGLPSDALGAVARLPGVDGATEVRGRDLRLTAVHDAAGALRLHVPAGAAIPVDALAIDPRGYATNLPSPAARLVRALPRDGAILGATSARLRGIGAGGTLTFGPFTVRVTGVLPDALVGGAEVVVRDDGPLPVSVPRFALVDYRGDRADLEAAIRVAWKVPVRFRAPGETPYLRQGDAVLPQALVKARFGEFWYRVEGFGHVVVDPLWVQRNIVSVDLFGLGRVRVHRAVVGDLRYALAHSRVSSALVVGFEPQLLDAVGGLSRHTWGIGISWSSARAPDAHTIDAFASAGFRWGGNWLTAVPHYFEWVGRLPR